MGETKDMNAHQEDTRPLADEAFWDEVWTLDDEWHPADLPPSTRQSHPLTTAVHPLGTLGDLAL
jgi:hypothetical protein